MEDLRAQCPPGPKREAPVTFVVGCFVRSLFGNEKLFAEDACVSLPVSCQHPTEARLGGISPASLMWGRGVRKQSSLIRCWKEGWTCSRLEVLLWGPEGEAKKIIRGLGHLPLQGCLGHWG